MAEEGECCDRISTLPDEILCFILSFLTTKEAAVTSVLSKRWNPLWRSVPTIDLDYDDFYRGSKGEDYYGRFVEGVNSVIRQNLHHPIHKFRLISCFSHFTDPADFTAWVNAAVQRRVRHLDLSLNLNLQNSEPPINLSSIFTCKTLVVLKLGTISSVDLPLLKLMHLCRVSLVQPECLVELLSGCPLLEDFKEKYVFLGVGKDECANCTPFKTLPKLLKADISTVNTSMLGVVNNVKFLHIYNIKGRINYFSQYGFPMFHNLTHMELEYVYYHNHNGWSDEVVELLKHCPKLQVLVICQLTKLEIPVEQAEQRLNFNGDPHTHPHPPHHDHQFAPQLPRLPRKRPWHHSNQGTPPDQVDSHVRVYVAPVPRTATEADVRLVFQGHGNIVEVVLLKDKRTGVRQGSCFVKYSTFNEADRAIKALNNQYTFPGEVFPVVVRFADRERERLGVRGPCRNLEKKDPPEGNLLNFPQEATDKVFVSSISKEASHKEIEEIFSPYGHIEDIFVATTRGYAFVKFSNREMALAAINGLNRTFTMRGCDHPLVVRFAEPKKPKTGESRGNYVSGNANFGPCSQESVVWPMPNFGDPNTGGSVMPIAPHHSTVLHPHVASNMPNWQPGPPVPQQPFIPQQAHSQMAPLPFQPIQAPNLSSQPFITEVQRLPHPTDSSVQNMEQQQLSSQLPNQTGSNPNTDTVASSTSPGLTTSTQDEEFSECDWSEHYCPDGHKYYFNCVTCESKWEMPEEYAVYEKESQSTQQEKKDNNCLLTKLSLSSSQEVAYRQLDTKHDHWYSETSLVAG